MNSEKLRRYISEELAVDPRFDASAVEVTVEDRVVTLAGQVPNYMDKWAIQHAVRALKGVRGVTLEIQVKCPVDVLGCGRRYSSTRHQPPELEFGGAAPSSQHRCR